MAWSWYQRDTETNIGLKKKSVSEQFGHISCFLVLIYLSSVATPVININERFLS